MMKFFTWFGLFFVASACHAADVELLQQTTVDTAALTFANGDETKFGNFPNGITFQQFPLRTYRGYQYTIYYDDERQVSVGRRKLPAGDWEVIHFTDYNITNHDTHNVAVLGICENDGTIHIAFDHHASDLHYRVSVLGAADNPEAVVWDAALFSPVTKNLGSIGAVTQVTYPRFFNAPNGNLMLYYRFGGSGNGDSMLQEYNGTTHDWTAGLGKFISRVGTYSGALSSGSTRRNAYINGISYGGTRLHATWGWRENSGGSQYNHDLCYAYSDDDGRTWCNSAGTLIGTTGSAYITLDSPGIIVAGIEQNEGLSNQFTHYAYPDGGCHVMLRHNDTYQHYWRDATGNWSHEGLVTSGSRPELLGDDPRNLFLIYTSGEDLRILRGIPNAGLTAWAWSSIYNEDNPTTAGDGQIDPSRWRSERVLSIYGQEQPSTILDYGSGTPFDGLPTPLHMTDLQVSFNAALPNPSHRAVQVPVSTSLSWTAGLDAVAHQVYFGTNPVAVATATTNSPQYMGQQTTTQLTLEGLLAEGRAYFWRIDEVDVGQVVRPGLLWSFKTETILPLMIQSISDQIIPINTSTPVLSFMVSDGTHSADTLVVSGTSSNTGLVPNANIVIRGSGSIRTVTVTPATDLSGVADITLSVSNGSETTSTVFRLTVEGLVFHQDENFGEWHMASTWDPDGIPSAGNNYTSALDLNVNDASNPFGGDSLTIQSGGWLRLRDSVNSFVVHHLIMDGGLIFGATGNNKTFALDGTMSILSDSSFSAYWNASGPRNLRILSKISGAATITCKASNDASTHTVFIENESNDYSGRWISENGTLEFTSAGAVGSADIEVQAHGKLKIPGDWATTATLMVADSTNALIHLDDHTWTIAGVIVGATNLAEGTYSAADLNGLSATVFTGTGQIIVGVVEPPVLNFVMAEGELIFSWSEDGFKLQSLTNDLSSGVWFDVLGGGSSPVSIIPLNPVEFWRLIQQ